MQCDQSCLTCDGSGPNQCTSCPEGKYLKTDKSCVNNNGCTGNTYADPVTMTCKDSAITDCTTCEYNATVSKPQCTACNNNKKVKTAIDGTTTCVTVTSDCVDENHFKADDDSACYLCSDSSGSGNDQGKDNCKKCAKASGQPPVCSECLDGYFFNTNTKTCTDKCADNCATCSAETAEDKCLTCKAGFFLVEVAKPAGKCVPCDSKTDNGIEGCAECDNSTGSLKCTKCKPNRKPAGNQDNYTCTEKTCEDPTACGGTAGSCDATVIDNQGNAKHYCSYCGEANKFPIDGICVESSQKNGNNCNSHTCTSCAANYFLYMGGCYSTQKAPGSFMCSKADSSGICTEAASNKYFVVPGASNQNQSVLACGNPLGTLIGTGNTAKAYVGVDGCSRCTAPTALTTAGMTVAVCTSCDSSKKPNRDGSGCVLCSVSDCKSCVVDDVCGECVDGYSLDNGKCVSMSTNRSGLSTGAIAGISVAVIAVVGGLVGFLCWWFICRGKA
eukprot:XP_001705783.1 VSP [Giardia lamblia ATCC 50803]